PRFESSAAAASASRRAFAALVPALRCRLRSWGLLVRARNAHLRQRRIVDLHRKSLAKRPFQPGLRGVESVLVELDADRTLGFLERPSRRVGLSREANDVKRSAVLDDAAEHGADVRDFESRSAYGLRNARIVALSGGRRRDDSEIARELGRNVLLGLVDRI